jgi:hypothetical protein
MKIVYRSLPITLAALILAGSALAAPVETVLYSFKGGRTAGGNFIGDGAGARSMAQRMPVGVGVTSYAGNWVTW